MLYIFENHHDAFFCQSVIDAIRFECYMGASHVSKIGEGAAHFDKLDG